VRIALLLIVLASCLRGEHRPARDTFNDGVAALAKQDYDAAEKALLEARSGAARSGAGVDPELRFRAAYDLGVAYAAHAEKFRAGQDEDLAKALELEQQAVSWLSDAQRQHDDPDVAANLAIARARAQAIGDDLRKAEGKLDARLDAVIKDQRAVLDEARLAWLSIKQAGGADPLAQQGTLTHLADRERGIVAEAGVIGDLASDEIDAIGKKKEEQRSDEEKARVVQLKNLDLYLLEGRARIAESRRKLQELDAEHGVDRAEAALVALKRAREQLLDPIAVLQRVAQDELALAQETRVGKPDVLGKAGIDQVPGWLAPGALADRQGGLRDRVEEVRARLQAAVDAKPDPSAKPDAKRDKLMAQVATALPHVGDASAAMDRARAALVAARLDDAAKAEDDALAALALAIEVFADLKQTVELAYATHEQAMALLSPDAAKQLPADERARKTREAVTGNLARLGRIQELIAAQVAELDAHPAPDAGSGSAAAPQQAQQFDQMKQQMAEAERLRGEAEVALGQLQTALDKNTDPLAPAKTAETNLAELRKLFFNIVEHLQELIREQGETHDQTSTAAGEDDVTRAPKLPGLLARQDQHGAMARAITDALAKQADEAGKSQQPPQQGAPNAKTLAQAADEVRAAQTDMGDAGKAITAARDAQNKSVSLEPAATSQTKALEHLENALKLLQPPKQKQNKDDKQDQQQQDQQKKQDQQQQPQGGAGQRARDEDAKRQKERAHRGGGDPVEKDW
jgi:hypothetical protein